ncbi:uncharacterized protein LOC142171687 [Nicotiana tabacum]|uniref:Uncharacterized protein LOC142171687 n=1 Tax=Nicotiana tabacum TaxID=4097 RepID=A0AC58T2N3_TOBAC
MNDVAKELYSSIVYASFAYNVWKDLKERFDKRNISRVYNLHHEIIALKQGLALISTYYSKLKDLWDEYDVMIPTSSCPCPESRVKGQIMLMIPTPTINEAYKMRVQDESQRTRVVGPSTLEIRAQAMANNTGHEANTMVHNSGQGFIGGYKPKNQLYCDYCRMKGHTRDGCYKIIGYPADFKSKRKQFEKNTTVAHNVQVDIPQEVQEQKGNTSITLAGHFFTEEQYHQLLQMLNKTNSTYIYTTSHAKFIGIPLSLLNMVKENR